MTGASSGIGEATALALAAEGARVAVVARRKDRLDDLVGRIAAAGGEALAVEGDVTDEAAARDAVAQTVDRFGRLDTVVANAGVMLLGPIEDAPVEEWQRMVDLNVMACCSPRTRRCRTCSTPRPGPRARSPTWCWSAAWPGGCPARAAASRTEIDVA